LSFAEIFSNRKLESVGYREVLFVWSYRSTFSCSSRTPTCDRQTNTQLRLIPCQHGVRGKKN